MQITPKQRNRTIVLGEAELVRLRQKLVYLHSTTDLANILGTTICQDNLDAVAQLPDCFVDLLFLDPPYNLDKVFNQSSFKQTTFENYKRYLQQWLKPMLRLLKPTASVYICADWRSSPAVFVVASELLLVRNRITWEREKGRGAKTNWKNCSEDIWFFTVSEDYFFNVDAVKLKRKVLAPYKDNKGNPKDWELADGGNFRLTHPSNLWTDLTVPFWSMPENTNHPTQKPEKLLAKIILASTQPNDIVLDPFLGSGTTSVVAKKLGRQFIGVERDELYCCLAEKRLELAKKQPAIQGYSDGVFWERNTLSSQKRANSLHKNET